MIERLGSDIVAELRSGVALTNISQCVEELVLNSLDAGSTSITVDVDICNASVEVSDNGMGIDQIGLKSMGNRYFTSKCHSLKDLDNAASYGFRGEAVASLSKICEKLEIITRHKTSYKTFCKLARRGKYMGVYESTSPRSRHGTTVSAHGIFHMLPVRRKLMSSAIDLERIRRQVVAIAIMHPNVSLTLRNKENGCTFFQTHQSVSVLSTMFQIFGCYESKAFKPISNTCKSFKLSGYVSLLGYPSKNLQFFYLNKRLVLKTRFHKVTNCMLSNGVSRTNNLEPILQQESAKNPKSKDGDRYAGFVINLECPPSAYDITFDPAKTLVEFVKWDDPMHCLTQCLNEFLTKEGVVDEKEVGNYDWLKEGELCSASTKESRFEAAATNANSNANDQDEPVYKKSISPSNMRWSLCSLTAKRKQGLDIREYERRKKSPKNCSTSNNDANQFNKDDSSNNNNKVIEISGKLIDHVHSNCPDLLSTASTEVTNSPPSITSCCENLTMNVEPSELSSKWSSIYTVLQKVSHDVDRSLCKSSENEKPKCTSEHLSSYGSTSPSSGDGSGKSQQVISQRSVNRRTPLISLRRKTPGSNRTLKSLRRNFQAEGQLESEDQMSDSRTHGVCKTIDGPMKVNGCKIEDVSRQANYCKTDDVTRTIGDSKCLFSNLMTLSGFQKVDDSRTFNISITGESPTEGDPSTEGYFMVESNPRSDGESSTGGNVRTEGNPNKVGDFSTDGYSIVQSNSRSNGESSTDFRSEDDFMIESDSRTFGNSTTGESRKVGDLSTMGDFRNESYSTLAGNSRPDSESSADGSLMLGGDSMVGGDSRTAGYIKPQIESAMVMNSGDPKTALECNKSLPRVSEDTRKIDTVPRRNSKEVVRRDLPQSSDPDDEIHFGDDVVSHGDGGGTAVANLDGDSAPVNSEWLCQYDSSHGRQLYVNARTGNTSLENPMASGVDTGKLEVKTASKRNVSQTQTLHPFASHLSHNFTPWLPRNEKRALGSSGKGSGGTSTKEHDEFHNESTGVHVMLNNWVNPVFEGIGKTIACANLSTATKKVHGALQSFSFTKECFKHMKVIRQLDNKFIVCHYTGSHIKRDDDLLVIVDQHAAHERVRLEKFTKDLYSCSSATPSSTATPSGIKSSCLTSPCKLFFCKYEVSLMNAFRTQLEHVGITFQEVHQSSNQQQKSVIIKTVPSVFLGREQSEIGETLPSDIQINVEDLIKEQIEVLLTTKGASTATLPRSVVRVLNSQACHGAIRFGDVLSLGDSEDLIKSLAKCDLPFQCAHGRPSMIPLINIDLTQKKMPKKAVKLPQVWKIRKRMTTGNREVEEMTF